MSYYARYEDTICTPSPAEEDAMTLAEEAAELATAWEDRALDLGEEYFEGGEFDVTELMVALDLLTQARDKWDGTDEIDWQDNDTLADSESAVVTVWADYLGVDAGWNWQDGYALRAA